MKILSITPHLGGGVGNVLSNWAIEDEQNEHTIISLGFNHKLITDLLDFYDIQHISNFYNIDNRDKKLNEYVKNADIIIIHYWNFPLLLDFLINTEFPECRMIGWSHTSGIEAPYVVPRKIKEYMDMFFYTSLSSKDATISSTIRSTGGMKKYQEVKSKEHSNFNIIYIGTLDFSKMRSDFIDICEQILLEIPDTFFTICGDGCNADNLKESVTSKGIGFHFNFTGFVDDITPYLAVSDIFLYPLTSTHFGTAEQIIGQAMSAGVIPVVFNNFSETEVVKNNVNGFVVNNTLECIEAISEIKNNAFLRVIMSSQAVEDANEIYSMDKMINSWNKVFKKIMLKDKKSRDYFLDNYIIEEEGTTAFMESLGEVSDLFDMHIAIEKKICEFLNSTNQWKSESKGSINHYLQYFKNDSYLNKWKKIMESEIK